MESKKAPLRHRNVAVSSGLDQTDFDAHRFQRPIIYTIQYVKKCQ